MSLFKNLKTQAKLLIIFAALTFIGALITGWSIFTTLRLQEEIRYIFHKVGELSDAEETQTYFLEQELASKNYLLTGDHYYLNKYEDYSELTNLYLRRASMDTGPVEERIDLDFLGKYQEAYERSVDEVVATYDAENPDQVRHLDVEKTDGEADRVQDQIGSIAYKRKLDLQGLVQQSDNQARKAVLIGVIGLLSLSVLMIVAFIVINQVTEPMLHLTNAVVAFENRTFEPDLLAGYTKRRDEMGQLVRAFDAMVRSITESVRLKDQFLDAAARFVPNQYLDFLEKESIIEVKLGDHVSAEMAVMFSDIRGFTTMSESMSPQQNFDFVNTYLKLVSPLIQKHNGFIVKFLGDGMMAIFPYSVDDAVRAGIEKRQQVEVFNAELQKQGLPPVQVGIGIHTGHMMVGMIGEELRMQGDAFSDNVNLTSRVEGLTKFYGVSMLITEETLMRLEQPVPYQMRFLGKAQVKGRERPISLYDVFEGDPGELRTGKLETKTDFEQGLKLYTVGKFAEAQKYFEAVLQRCPEDKTATFYLERLTTLMTQGVPVDWDGVEIMASK